MLSVLDGGSQILLANIMTPKRLICTYASDMPCPVPSHNYVLVNRSMLCNCHMESGLIYLPKSIAFCETASADYSMSFTLNLALLYIIQDLWPDNFTLLPPNLTKEELSFPLGLTSNAEFRQKDTNVSYPLTPVFNRLESESEGKGRGTTKQKTPFYFVPKADIPNGTPKKGIFCFIWPYMYFIFLQLLLFS